MENAGDPVEIIAHRGYSGRAPENTISAIQRALEVGARAIEWDLQVSASGTPYLFHDDTLERTTDGSGRFEHSTDSFLATLDAGAWFGPAFRGEPIPTLARTLAALDKRALRIYPEIKTFRCPDHVDAIVRHVRRSGWMDRTVFISMDWDALGQVRQRAPDVWIGYIVDAPKRYPDAATRAAADSRALVDVDQRIALSDPETTRSIVANETEVAVWTVNDVPTAARLRELGVSRFTTNEVETLLRWAGGLAP